MKVEYEVQISGVGCSVDLTTKDYSESLVLYTMKKMNDERYHKK